MRHRRLRVRLARHTDPGQHGHAHLDSHAHVHANRDADTDDGHGNSHDYAVTHCYAQCDFHTPVDTQRADDRITDAQLHIGALADVHLDGNAHTDGNAYAHGDRDSHANTKGNPYPHARALTPTHIHDDSHGDAVVTRITDVDTD